MKYTSDCTRTLFLLGVAALGFGLVPQADAQPTKVAVKVAVKTAAKRLETVGGGTVAAPAVGPAPAYGLGGPGMVLVKNWHFGTSGTIKNYADMNANFYYHDQFGTKNNGGKYGSNTVAPDFADAMGGQPIEGVNSPPVRKFTADSLKTFLTPLDKAVKVQVWNHNLGNGSFMAKWRLPQGGSLLGRDIVWETRVRYVTPPYFWFSIWTAGNKWKWDGQAQGAEQDLIESFGYDNGGGNTNYDGRYWHSNTVASPAKDTVDYGGWGTAMAKQGIKSYDASQYHIWTWLYKKDNTFAMYVDGIKVQGGRDYYWTFGNTAKDEPIDMDFLFDGSWGHNQISSVNKELPASAFDGKFYEWNYSRVYLSGDHGAGHSYKVQIPAGGHYRFRFQVAAPSGGTFHVEDETGANLTGAVSALKTGKANKTVTVLSPDTTTLSSGPHLLKWVQDTGASKLIGLNVTPASGPTAQFIKTDLTTQGNWKGVYGADGFVLASDAARPPSYGTVTRTGWGVAWAGSTSDSRALQKNGTGTDRVAGQWGTSDKSYDLDCSMTDSAVHQVALYGLDWDLNGRSEDIQVVDAATGRVLDTEDLNTYTSGKYLVWNVRGHVIFRVITTSRWTNPALSGIFFDPIRVASPKKSVRKA